MPRNDRPRRTSLVMPILLIALGALFLYREVNPGFEPFHFLHAEWRLIVSLILILVGLGKIWDSARARAAGESSGVALGTTLGAVAVVLVLVIVLGHYARRGYARSADNNNNDSDTITEQVVERGDAREVSAELKMGAGELNISGGSSHLLNSRFSFSPRWDSPQVDYRIAAGKGNLEISQEKAGITFGRTENTWDLNFNNDVPLELNIEMGAGQGNLKLRDMNVTNFVLQMGAGQVELDLTGARKSDLHVEIKGGVGQATIRLPKDVGVSAHAAGGLGSIDADGLKKEGSEYINQAYGKTPHKITLDVQGGIGEIDLIEE